MNSKLFAGLALAATLLAGQPVFAHDDNRGSGNSGGGSGRSAGDFRGVSGGGSGRVTAYSGGGTRGSRGGTFASGRSYRAPSIAYAGSSYNSRAYGGRAYSRNGNSTYAFSSRQGWSHSREYAWHGHHYRWYNNGWFIVDPYPYYAEYPPYGYYENAPAYPDYGPGDDEEGGGPVSVQVQRKLAREGYYRGPIDGIVGPGTRAAIADYQHDNGLRVTGAINGGLLNSLDPD